MIDCRICSKEFTPFSTTQAVCSRTCAIKYVRAEKKAKREQTKVRKEAAKPRQKLTKEAIHAFNAFIRKRDHGKPCICCGKPMPWHESTPGGYIDAGHYLGTGAAPELRFVEENVSAQLKSCNKPGGTTRAKFRAGMIERWGIEVVERLEGPHPAQKLTADDLREIRDTYREKLKSIKDHA